MLDLRRSNFERPINGHFSSSFLIFEIIFALIVLKIPNLFDSPKL